MDLLTSEARKYEPFATEGVPSSQVGSRPSGRVRLKFARKSASGAVICWVRDDARDL